MNQMRLTVKYSQIYTQIITLLTCTINQQNANLYKRNDTLLKKLPHFPWPIIRNNFFWWLSLTFHKIFVRYSSFSDFPDARALAWPKWSIFFFFHCLLFFLLALSVPLTAIAPFTAIYASLWSHKFDGKIGVLNLIFLFSECWPPNK